MPNSRRRGPKRAQHRHQRLRLADRGGVEPHVVQTGQRGAAGAGVGRVEAARRVRQDQPGVGIACAVVAHLALVVRVGQCGVAHQVQGDEPAAFVRLLPHPLGQESRRRRLPRVAGAGGVAPVDLEAADLGFGQRFDGIRRALRRGQQRGADAVVAAGGLDHEAVYRAGAGGGVGEGQQQPSGQPLRAADDGRGVRPPLGHAAVGRAGRLHERRDRIHVSGSVEVRVGVGDALGKPVDQRGQQRPVGLGLAPAVRRGWALHTLSHARNGGAVNGGGRSRPRGCA